jgi:hypothetical protein
VARVSRSRIAGLSCYGVDAAGLEFVLDRGEHADGGVAALAVVEDFLVLEDRVGQLDPGLPFPAVEQLGLHAAPDQLGHDHIGPAGTTPVNDGAWHHVALVRHGRTASLYIDGVLEATATAPRPVDLWNDMPLRAGASICDGIDGTRSFRGELDEMMIFGRALTKIQIQALITYLKGSTP